MGIWRNGNLGRKRTAGHLVVRSACKWPACRTRWYYSVHTTDHDPFWIDNDSRRHRLYGKDKLSNRQAYAKSWTKRKECDANDQQLRLCGSGHHERPQY